MARPGEHALVGADPFPEAGRRHPEPLARPRDDGAVAAT